MYQGTVTHLDSYKTRNLNSSPSQIKKNRLATIPSEGKDRTLNKWTSLIRLYTRQKRLAEFKTQCSIECCHDLISREIRAFFSEKNLILNSNPIETYFHLSDRNEIEVLTQNIQRMIDEELFSRFKIIPTSETSIDLFDEDISSQFRLIQEWRSSRKRTILMTQQIERWSQSVWNEGLNRVISLQPLATALELINLPQLFLQSLGIDSSDQLQTLHTQTRERVEGILISLEYRFISKLKRYCSQLFYTMHDEIIDQKFNQKIIEFETRISNPQNYDMEA